MALTRARFDAIKRSYGAVGSWAVWADAEPGRGVKDGVGDLSILDPDDHPAVLDVLNPEIVMLGINGSESYPSEPFRAFHDPSVRANHFKLRHAYRDTPFWGAYLTDAFKGIPCYGAARTIAFLRAHPDVVDEQLDALRAELDALGADDPLLIAFGRGVHDLLQEHLGADFRIARVPHYAHHVSKEDYRAQALAAIDGYLVSASDPAMASDSATASGE